MTPGDSFETLRSSEAGPPDTAQQRLSAQANQASATTTVNMFKPFGVIPLFTYLTPITNRTDWYRAIMHTFFQSSREYRYHLTAQDILEAVRDSTRLDLSAQALFEEGLALAREAQDTFHVANATDQLAREYFFSRGDAATARSLYEESLALYRAVGAMWLTAYIQSELSDVVLH